MVLEEVIPSFNWGILWFWAQVSVVILFLIMSGLFMLYILSFKIKGIILRRRAGGMLKAFKTAGRYIKKSGGNLDQIKLLKRRLPERKPPQQSLINMGRRDFMLWYEDDAGDIKPFRIHVDRGIVKKTIQNVIRKTHNDPNAVTSLLLNYFCPSLSVDDVDMRFWKVQQDKATESVYKKVEKWKDILYIGGFVIMVVMFVVGMVLMKSVCT